MFTLEDVRKEYDRLDALLGISTKDIPIKKMKGFRNLGACCNNLKLNCVDYIKINKVLFECPEDEFYETIRHEYAHAANFLLNGISDYHGSEWQEICRKIGASGERYLPKDSRAMRALTELYFNS